MNTGTGISIWHIWIVDPSKMRGFPSFQIGKRLNSKNQYMKLIFRMTLKHKYVYESRYFQLDYLKYWLRKCGFCLYFRSVNDYIQRINIWNWYSEWLWNINMYMIPGISNWLIWNIDSTKMRILSLFQLDTRLLTSKHPKTFST